ncbi:hypothetical protein K493DRAFT_319563 [Basidiobolus meristosporus CBS 931.73]|uniref:Prokaryotic-type class I peptide chain release factors domain-containing protein n=1 Tax=Basidiobolus meristosporus CBS 931.73 TaxID=1314790 RepID=A0A1Y1XQZ8_9FUNG|nr:hypothetical protein K493DRAFT_319563 [Basidiobolus meristosporus CBS 931.73]|eukprot:ORX88182.1 hypothetical protein K493DRAFT_319563 [Basidiobolus meristosporus CBS 931.73]
MHYTFRPLRVVLNPLALITKVSPQPLLLRTKAFTQCFPLLCTFRGTTSLRLFSSRANKADLQAQLNLLEAEWLDSTHTQADIDEDQVDVITEDEALEQSDIETPTSFPKHKPIKIVLNEEDLVEKFVKGSGNGGQKINKTNSNVDLLHIPSGIRVQCQKTRSLSLNRKEARKLLIRKLDDMHNGDMSKSAQKIKKIQKKKANKARRTRQKYGATGDSPPAVPDSKQ